MLQALDQKNRLQMAILPHLPFGIRFLGFPPILYLGQVVPSL